MAENGVAVGRDEVSLAKRSSQKNLTSIVYGIQLA